MILVIRISSLSDYDDDDNYDDKVTLTKTMTMRIMTTMMRMMTRPKLQKVRNFLIAGFFPTKVFLKKCLIFYFYFLDCDKSAKYIKSCNLFDALTFNYFNFIILILL